MVLLTGGAVVVGAIIVAFLVLTGQSPKPTGDGSLPLGLIAPAQTIPAGLEEGRTLGAASAPVTLEVWSDFQCPACEQLATITEPSIITTFVAPGTLRIVYHDAAFQGAKAGGSYDESVEAGAAARCAADQNRFWDMHAWLFANQRGENVGSFTADRLRAMAQEAGLDLAKYDACMATGTQQSAVKDETTAAIDSGINSTPTMSINGQRQVGALGYDKLAQLIRDAASPSPAASAPAASAAATPSPS